MVISFQQFNGTHPVYACDRRVTVIGIWKLVLFRQVIVKCE